MLGYLDMTLIKQTIEGATLCSCKVVQKSATICNKPIISFKNKIYRLLREKNMFIKVQNIKSEAILKIYFYFDVVQFIAHI